MPCPNNKLAPRSSKSRSDPSASAGVLLWHAVRPHSASTGSLQFSQIGVVGGRFDVILLDSSPGMDQRLNDVIQTLRSHRTELFELGVSHASIFGSVARGEARADSDIDVLVELDRRRPMGIFEYSRHSARCSGCFSGMPSRSPKIRVHPCPSVANYEVLRNLAENGTLNLGHGWTRMHTDFGAAAQKAPVQLFRGHCTI
jgi:predicted nucleotidyltransferase